MPVYDDLPGWHFRVIERSAGVFEIAGTFVTGGNVTIVDTDPQIGLQRAREAASAMDVRG